MAGGSGGADFLFDWLRRAIETTGGGEAIIEQLRPIRAFGVNYVFDAGCPKAKHVV